jgi:hypothetical protein
MKGWECGKWVAAVGVGPQLKRPRQISYLAYAVSFDAYRSVQEEVELTRGRKLNPRVLAVLLAGGGLVFQIGCATAGLGAHHPAFTADQVLGLEVGMTTDSVVSLFGRPDRTEVTTCGSATKSPWRCLIWEYDMGSYKTNRLTFSAESSPPRLNNWTIDKMYDNRKP